MPANILKAVIDVSAPNIEQVADNVASEVKKTETALAKLPKAVKKAADGMKNLAVPSAGLDFSKQFEAARAKISASVDKMAADFLAASNSVEKIGDAAAGSVGPVLSLQRAVEKFGGGVKSFDVAKNFQAASQAIKGLNNMPAPFKSVKAGANEATQSMVNLGRVVQDAPFGFLGIANNLNPLLESFQRLKASTGTTSGALKALGSSLMGAGGLGLAISVASSLLVVFGDRIFGASKKAKEAEDANKKYKDSVEGIFSSLAKEATEAGSLVAVLKSETETRERKLEALKELKRIQPEIFGQLKLEGNAVVGLDNAYKSYIDNMRTVIAVKIKQAQLEKLITEQLQRQGATLTKSEKKNVEFIKNFQDSLAKSREKLSPTGDPLAPLLNEMKANAEKKDKEIFENIEGLFKDIEELSKGVKIGDFKEGKSDADKFFDDTIQKAKELAAFLDKNTQFQVGFEIDPRDKKEDTFKKAKEFIAKAQSFFDKNASDLGVFKFKPQVRMEFDEGVFKNISAFVRNEKLINNLRSQAEILGTRSYDETKKSFEAEIKRRAENDPFIIEANANMKPLKREEVLERGGQVFINPVFDDKDLVGRLKTATALINEQFIDIAKNFQQTLGSAIGQGIGDALSGGGFGALFKGIFNVVGSAMQSLGEALLATAIGLKAIKAAFKTLNPAVALAAGIGLIALGAVIKNTVGNIGGRAGGGPVQAGKPYTVGELGRELFIPSSAGRIIPNNALRSSGSGGFIGAPQFALSATNSIRGKDIVQVFTLEMISQGRTG